jgi:cytochrome c oxidase cbb3-type subunit 4
MDLNDIRSAVTLASLVLFVALLLHTWSRRRHDEHRSAAALPFEGDRPESIEQPAAGERGERRE